MIRYFLVALMTLLAPGVAWAGTCDATNQYNFAFANQTARALAYGSTYSYTATTALGASQSLTVTITQNGLSSSVVNSTTQLPAIDDLITGTNATQEDLVLGGTFSGRTADITSNTRVVTVTFTFTTPVRDFTMVVHDVDYTSNQYRDWIQVTGSNGSSSYVPATVTPWGNGNGSSAPRTAALSSLAAGATTTPVTITASQAVGTGASDNNSDDGTISASFAQPVTSVTLRYGNYPLQRGESTTGQQAIGIAGISFCPMPSISVVKTSAPRTGFNVPGNDVIYTLTVTNSGASPVDASSIVLSDVLPTGVTFLNSAFDATTTLPVKLALGTSGVTLAASGLAYSGDSGATWTYTPAGGYDANVKGVRITPGGTMAANSSFALSFVARIK